MALIKCPECGKKISDKATSCIQCGCPISTSNNTVPPKLAGRKRINKRGIILISLFVIVIALCLIKWIFLPFVEAAGVEKKYQVALSVLEQGNYEEAHVLLDEIRDYKNVNIIKEQIKYESYAIACINSYKQNLKSPDSIQIYNIDFFDPEIKNEDTAEDTSNDTQIMYEPMDKTEKNNYPVCVIYSGAQNGFGGITTGYSIFKFEDDTGYRFMGSCDSLDIEDYVDEDITEDIDMQMEILTFALINNFYENGSKVGSVDLNRISTILKNNAYSTIKILD